MHRGAAGVVRTKRVHHQLVQKEHRDVQVALARCVVQRVHPIFVGRRSERLGRSKLGNVLHRGDISAPRCEYERSHRCRDGARALVRLVQEDAATLRAAVEVDAWVHLHPAFALGAGHVGRVSLCGQHRLFYVPHKHLVQVLWGQSEQGGYRMGCARVRAQREGAG